MQTHYERLGGGDVIRKLVDRFYDLMDEDPDYYGIRKLHPADLTESRNKLFWFLSGWTGGPPEYTDRFGHPFQVGDIAVDHRLLGQQFDGKALHAIAALAAVAEFDHLYRRRTDIQTDEGPSLRIKDREIDLQKNSFQNLGLCTTCIIYFRC